MTGIDRAVWPESVDVLVAGSGAAGLTAALAAASCGARVLVIERAEQLGGTTALSGGRVWVPCNGSAPNADDTADAARRYLHGLIPDRHTRMVDVFVDRASEMARFIERASPHRFVACSTYPDYHPDRDGATLGGRCLDMEPADTAHFTSLVSAIRIPPWYVPLAHREWEQWRYPQFFDHELLARRSRRGIHTGGVALVANLLQGAVCAGATVLPGVRLVGLDHRHEDGWRAVTAGGGSGGDGVTNARAVILATGGFDWDTELRRRHHPSAQSASGAPPSNDGDGLRLARRAGAAVDNLAEGWWMPMMHVPGETLDGEPVFRALIRERAAPRQIIVDMAGTRFADEAAPYNDFGKAMHRLGSRSGGQAHLVFDEGFRRRYPLPGVPRERDVPEWVARGQSPRELAGRLAIDAAGLERTVARWNAGCAQGFDPDFGRGANPYDRYGGDPDAAPNPNLGPLDEPPFYAVRVLAGTIGTKGGPVTDTDGRVLRDDGAVISGLYAAGNAAAFWLGDAYPAPGATLGIGMTMGYLAGRDAGAHVAGRSRPSAAVHGAPG